MSYIYLATPYTHADARIMHERYSTACTLTVELMRLGLVIYSPIVHCHQLAIQHDLPKTWDYWQHFDEVMISKASKLLVAKMDGWQESRGVQAEIEIANRLGIPVEFLEV